MVSFFLKKVPLINEVFVKKTVKFYFYFIFPMAGLIVIELGQLLRSEVVTILLWRHLIGSHHYPLWRDGQFYIRALPGISTWYLWYSSRLPYSLHQLVDGSQEYRVDTNFIGIIWYSKWKMWNFTRKVAYTSMHTYKIGACLWKIRFFKFHSIMWWCTSVNCILKKVCMSRIGS